MNKKEEGKIVEEAEAINSQKECFVIMPIADTIKYDPGHFNRVLEFIIEPACEKEGYKAIRADKVSSSNLIMFDVLKRILRADIAICDLSSRNPNVMYELAVRQCFDLPVILIKDNDTIEPFDSSGIRYIEYDKQLRIDLVKIAVDKISNSIRETVKRKDEDVFSLLQILGRAKAQVKETNVDPMMVKILEQLNNLSNQVNNTSRIQNTVYYNSSQDDINLRAGFVPINEVYNIIKPSTGTSLNYNGVDLRVNGIENFGDKVVNTFTGKVGTLIGVGSGRGTGVFIVQLDDGSVIAARPDSYMVQPN